MGTVSKMALASPEHPHLRSLKVKFLNQAHEEGEGEMQTSYQNPAVKQAFRRLAQ